MVDPDKFEDELIEEFRQHPVLKHVELLTDTDFVAVLLQRRFLSLVFTTAYDLAIDLLCDERGLRIARIILREEYPDSKGYTRSHREDLKEDLLQLGVPIEDLAQTRPTQETIQTIAKVLTLISQSRLDDYTDVRLLTILRFWGELLNSVEYGELWHKMAPRLIKDGKNYSRFYYPHHVHDAKTKPLSAASPLSATHSDQLGIRLWQLLDSDEAKTRFMRMEEECLVLRMKFYDQFTPMLKNAEMGMSAYS